jgi:acylphosphatase
MATGSEEQLDKLIEWCRKGPKRAIVTGVVENSREEEHFISFEVLRRQY